MTWLKHIAKRCLLISDARDGFDLNRWFPMVFSYIQHIVYIYVYMHLITYTNIHIYIYIYVYIYIWSETQHCCFVIAHLVVILCRCPHVSLWAEERQQKRFEGMDIEAWAPGNQSCSEFMVIGQTESCVLGSFFQHPWVVIVQTNAIYRHSKDG